MEKFFYYLGLPVVNFYKILEKFGAFILFEIKLLPLFFKPPYRIKEILQQIEIIGVGSFFVIALTAIFTGLVEAIQLYHGFHKFSAESFMGYTIFVSISKELGPVFGALMLVSRAISAMTAELGTMRVTEQIDAIDTLAVDSKKYLIIPRVIATTISTPILVIIFVFLGNIAAYLISTYALGVNPTEYKNTITTYLEFSDIGTGIIKAVVFGYLISIIGTYIGYFTRGGARGVGLSTTKAVVYAAMTVFAANYFLSSLFLYLDW
ncbi:MlaE family ABC transporter permease [Nitratiruptor tergarcus]|uniref:Phospholipid/cholesterol/gamma-HCH transport system permease protein n=1 Tax=Nitratiruptor tergarcus DSM 16512 TaxID=1069081 RepID=A0A1W1WU39_9BACT|nr:ABC transporter permease [Nitratiruptor tergarcus]SMC09838.1 phospholipid/cholesterol/gamma-HCH transport system permease protein [Nitratiruptor tergarcus DSM 16512]